MASVENREHIKRNLKTTLMTYKKIKKHFKLLIQQEKINIAPTEKGPQNISKTILTEICN